MFGDLFDSPWKILIVAVVLIVLFGSKKLPQAARSVGQSMKILKREVQGLHEDDTAPASPAASTASAAFPPPAEIAATQPADQSQAQIDALQQQIRDLQRAATLEPAQAPVPQHTPQSS
jgi:sec-independent protein translocase protein TatA